MIRVKPTFDNKGISVDQPFASIWEKIQWRATPQWAVVMSLVAAGAILGLSQISEFLYFQF